MNAPNGMDVDHINHNGTDNRKENLRVCTRSQNMQNGLPRRDVSSKYKGVSWDKVNQRWRTCIRYEGRQVNLGRFSDEVSAANVYNERAKRVYGEFACINPIDI